MTEIPEHLRKRAEEARKKAAAAAGAATRRRRGGRGWRRRAAGSRPASKIPAHLLERAKKARRAGVAVARRRGRRRRRRRPRPPPPAPPPRWPRPPRLWPTGPGGHTQRLLTVVKSGSIQDVKATPQDKVHVWPHLLVDRVRGRSGLHRLPADLLDLRQRTAARAWRTRTRRRTPPRRRGTSSACRRCSRCSTRWWPA